MRAEQPSVPGRFVHDLNELRQRAGRPSYSALERLSGHELKRATMSDVLNGNRVRLPEWRFVAQFVGACRAAAVEGGLDESDLGTVNDWKRHWDGAINGVIDSHFPGHGRQPLTGQPEIPALRREQQARPGGSRSRVWGSLPARLSDFVGRVARLDALHSALAKADRAPVLAVQGMFGVGKTQLVLEYAYLHSHEYDLVWWVPSGTVESQRGALAELGAALGLADPSALPEESRYTELFDVLRRGQRYPRWLLIFDNVGEPEDIKHLMPPPGRDGHVLVTTRSSRWEVSGELIELDVFDRSESILFLRNRMRKLSPATAHRLAEGVGDLPLLLEHAAESNLAVDAYLARLESDPLGLLDDQPADYQWNVADEWRTAVDRLLADSSDAVELLQCLAFFGHGPVPRESLERGSYLTEISAHAMLRDPFKRLGAIKKLRRAGLLRVLARDESLYVHRVTQCVVRDMVVRSGALAAERARHDVHLLLAAADPLAPDDPRIWRKYDELRGHAEAVGVAECSQEIVRKFTVNLVRYRTAAGDPRAALSIADGVLARWEADDAAAASDPERGVDSHVMMRVALADALFACGRQAEAIELRQQALAAMRADSRRWVADVILLEGTTGAHLRAAGKFHEALAADRESVTAHVQEFGADDPRAFAAVNSLIADLALNGSGGEARAAAGQLHRDCLDFYSDAAHPAVLVVRNVLGRCEWLSGRPGEAVGILNEVRAGYSALGDRDVLDENHPWRLVNEIDHAVALRDEGLTADDALLLADEMYGVRRRCWRTLGPDHPLTLTAAITLVSLLLRIPGRSGEAVGLLAETEWRYQSTLPDHPYAFACAGFLAAVRCQTASVNARRVAKQSVPEIQAAAARLAEALGSEHPLSLSTASMEANALTRAGDFDNALNRSKGALAGFRALLGAGHPNALAVEANAAIIQLGLGMKPSVEGLRSRLSTALGPDHPDFQAFADNKLIDIDFTPLPL